MTREGQRFGLDCTSARAECPPILLQKAAGLRSEAIHETRRRTLSSCGKLRESILPGLTGGMRAAHSGRRRGPTSAGHCR